MIEDIKHVGPELKPDALVNREFAMDRKIEFLQRKSAYDVASEISGDRLPRDGQWRAESAFRIGAGRSHASGRAGCRRGHRRSVERHARGTPLSAVERGA